MMKDAHEILTALSAFPLVQLIVVGIIALAGFYLWVKSGQVKQSLGDGNRPATLYDLSQLRQKTQESISQRTSRVYARFDDIEHRLSVLEVRQGIYHPPYRTNPAEGEERSENGD